MNEMLGTDISLVGSGSIRVEEMGPIITIQNMMECFPYDDKVYMLKLSGYDLRRGFAYICRDEMIKGHTEFYQVSKQVRIVYDYNSKQLTEFTVNGKPVNDDDVFTVSMQQYHAYNIATTMNMEPDRIPPDNSFRCIATSAYDVLEEYLRNKTHLNAHIEGRITLKNMPPQYYNGSI